jgi:hypothetical protein
LRPHFSGKGTVFFTTDDLSLKLNYDSSADSISPDYPKTLKDDYFKNILLFANLFFCINLR